MLLQLNSGIFYEFIPANEYFDENPTRICIEDVKLNVNYVIILNTMQVCGGIILVIR